MVYCVRKLLTLPLRYCKGFLIVFIFTSGVGNGLLKPVHRLRSVPTETVRQPYTDLFEISTDEIETSALVSAHNPQATRLLSGTMIEEDHPPVSKGTPVTFEEHSTDYLNPSEASVTSIKEKSLKAPPKASEDPYTSAHKASKSLNASRVFHPSTATRSVDPMTRGDLDRNTSKNVLRNSRLQKNSDTGKDDKHVELDFTSEIKPKAIQPAKEVDPKRPFLIDHVPLPPSAFPTNTANNKTQTMSAASKEAVLLHSDNRGKIAEEEALTHIACFSETKNGNVSRHEVHQALLRDIQPMWTVKKDLKASVSPGSRSKKDTLLPKTETLQQYAKRIILPQIRVEHIPFSEALKVLDEVVKARAESGRAVNFILVDPKKTAPEIDLNIQNLSLERVLHYLSEMTQFAVLYEGNTVVFRDRSFKKTPQTRIFPISRGSVLQILSYTDLNNDINDKKLSEEERLKQFFQRIGIPFDTQNGFAYDGQNLIVTHEEMWLQRIEGILYQYRHCRQIAIEAKFLEVSQSMLDELGLKWNSGTGTTYNNNVQLNMNEPLRKLSALNSGSAAATNAPQFPNRLNYGSNIGDFLNANTILNRYQMNVVLRAIEQRSDSDLMCAPKVTVLSGRKAEIVIADELRYPESYRDGSGNVGNDGRGSTAAGMTIIGAVPERFTMRNVGVEMAVTPVAEDDDHIHLSLEPKVTELEGFVQYGGKNIAANGAGFKEYDSGVYQPTFSTRKIKTEVSLKNGSTVVMGGLTREEVKETYDKIPLLGDIPLFGKAFRSKGQTSQKKNLLIFVTANLVDENGRYVFEPEIQSSQPL